MSDGYLYCFSNDSMPGILKIGMTDRTPEIRLNEANSSDTWRPPTPYKIEFAKKVLNSKQKEISLHLLLSQYTERINPKREFFRISPEEVKMFFDIIDGEIWNNNMNDESDCETNSNDIKRLSRDMSKCFTDGQQIRHVIDVNQIWIGIYCSTQNMIIYDMKNYKTLSAFAESHNSIYKPYRKSANGWRECECEVNGKWISTYDI